jgi:hypothetical protein
MAVSVRVPLEQASWRLTLYPDAGEAGGSFQSARRTRPAWVPPGRAADPDRAKAEAARRARAKVRRYCAANRLNKLGTLTYGGAGCHDPRQARADVAEFFRDLREAVGGAALPYVWVPEWHKSDHGLHLHYAMSRWVSQRMIERVWGRGFVFIKRLSDMPVGTTTREEARKAAGYLSKYVSKTFDRPDLGGLHRYEVAQGFQPRAIRVSDVTPGGMLSQAVLTMGAEPLRRWSSQEEKDWQGPPAVWFAWA